MLSLIQIEVLTKLYVNKDTINLDYPMTRKFLYQLQSQFIVRLHTDLETDRITILEVNKPVIELYISAIRSIPLPQCQWFIPLKTIFPDGSEQDNFKDLSVTL